MRIVSILIPLGLFVTSAVFGQQKIYLKKRKSGRTIELKSKTNFGFDLSSQDNPKTLGYFGHIIMMTDSTLIVEEYVKPSMRHAVTARIDTITILDIKSIKNYLIDNDDFNMVGGMLIIGGVLFTAVTPVVWAIEGNEKGREGAKICLGLFATGGLFLLPQFIGKQRKMTKWEFVKALP